MNYEASILPVMAIANNPYVMIASVHWPVETTFVFAGNVTLIALIAICALATTSTALLVGAEKADLKFRKRQARRLQVVVLLRCVRQ
jgi:hypothetical protein